ncbi:TetR/AcrR family transcriptional regulator [Pendulispora rubella]|uniref:TetR/AcrR family transcriptional regulator n=1 Tax=Pendulispora rubella TaxID=2741070 RepID=A0ABZ2LLQ8_9BACT
MAGRGRPRSFDRQQALEAAMQVFWTKGYKGTSMADLTHALGINSPSLYAAFGSKEALFREAIELFTSDTQRYNVLNGLEEASTAREGIERMLRDTAVNFSQPASPGGCFITLAAIHKDCDELETDPIFEELRTMRAYPIERVRERVARAIAEGELPSSVDPAAIASFYITFQQGMSLRARDGASRDALLALAESGMRAWDALIG